MSHYDGSEYPTVILVKPAPRRKPSLPGDPLPWMKIAIGGSVAFTLLALMLGLYFAKGGDRQPIDDGGMPKVPGVIRLDQEPVVQKQIAEPKEEEAPDPLPLNKNDFVDCAQIGTDVRFLKDPTDAFKRAKAEKKMVYVIHLSGNLEDPEFT